MELGLSLGETSKPPFGFMEKANHQVNTSKNPLGFCMALSIGPTTTTSPRRQDQEEDGQISKNKQHQDGHDADDESEKDKTTTAKIKKTVCGAKDDDEENPPIQLDLLPYTPVPRNFLWPSSDNGSSEAGSSGKMMGVTRGFDVNRTFFVEEVIANNHEDGGAVSSSPNSASASSFQMDFCIYSGSANYNKDGDQGERASPRASDEDENGSTRKKLRLSKEQSAFLEESFKEHNTLNPKQKLALSKQLNLRPRQVEVWFQNRRARTKLKQTEVDCEYLKRCCETLTEENRRLQKELQELRALKTSNPFYMQLPATTLTMCPSCERVATTTTTTAAANNNSTDPTTAKGTGFSLKRPRTFYPFAHTAQTNSHQPAVSREMVKQIEK